ncbi:Uncharacterised protein [Mycobacteroides abscessus subsp. abscessus]|nr:Uncharacterised protein [Mycobacteroides abscessus subsp. abscessus]
MLKPASPPGGLDQGAQLFGVGHRDDARVVGDLVAGGVLVAIDGDGLDAQTLQGDQDLAAEFAGTEQHDTGGAR